MPALEELLHTLETVFGYDGFRPLQREIIETSLAGRDVLALLPTGGGKSMCFQLPALHRAGLTVVVSPLIALMKDQVDQLQAAGVAATYLNSSLDTAAARSRLAGLHRGEFRLLYVAPERLMLDAWKENLRAWNVTCLAIDEAHCISEWGHDFRPEFRQIAQLRDVLPDIPVIALTATATSRVRDDIVDHLRLRDPAVFVASFNRPNLTYRVLAKDKPIDQIVAWVRRREDESGIIYHASRAAAERTAEALSGRGFSARPYHAGLDAGIRSDNQESFLRDETKIICATIAFGMGINKPNVRWVVHHDLPKNLEGYYQETGRAGRDGLPSDCLLLYGPGDIAKQTHFIDEIADAEEQSRARRQLRLMADYAEGTTCRRRELLAYFGEDFPADRCGACDNCLEPRETYDGTLDAQKFLSCVYRCRQATRFGVGLNHIVEVLVGADTEKIRSWGHERLSTYGIGGDRPRHHWLSVGRELQRLGYVQAGGGEYPTLELTALGLDLLKNRRSVTLARPVELAPKVRRAPVRREGDLECDEILLADLRRLRKSLADERGVPAYVIFGDKTLRQLARDYPVREQDLHGVFGMGEKKREEFGSAFVRRIASFLETNPRQHFEP